MSSSVCFIVRSSNMPRGSVSKFFLTEYCPTVGTTVGCEEGGTYTVTLEGDNGWELETAANNLRNGLVAKDALIDELSMPNEVASSQPVLA